MTKGLRLVTLVAIVMVALVLWFFPSDITPIIKNIIAYIKASGIMGIAVFMGVYVIATIFMIPGSLLTLGAGFLYGPLYGVAIASLSSTLGACTAFLCGRYVIRPLITRKLAEPKFRSIDRAITARGARIVFLLRLSPLFPFALVNYSCSLTSIPFFTFAFVSFVGMLPATIVYVYAGSLSNSLLTLTDAKAITTNTYVTWLGLAISIFAAIIITRIAKTALQKELKKDSPPQ